MLLAVGIGALIFYGQKNIVSRAVEDQGWSPSCINVKFFIGDVCYESLTQDSKQGIEVKFSVRNDASINLYSFAVIAEYDNKETKSSFTDPVEIESSQPKRISSNFIEKTGEIEKIKIFPKIKIDNKVFSCEDSGFTIYGNEIEEC